MSEEVEIKKMASVPESTSSIEVTKNTKGYNWKVKAYDNDMDKALADIIRIEMELRKEFGE